MRHCDQPRAGDAQTHDMVRLGERPVDVAALFRRGVADVAVQLFAGQRRSRLEGLFGLDDRWLNAMWSDTCASNRVAFVTEPRDKKVIRDHAMVAEFLGIDLIDERQVAGEVQ